MDLDLYREAAETFLAELTREYYRHYAGLQESYEIEPIYDRHRALFTRKAVEDLRAARARAAGGSEQQRRTRMLLDFTVDGYVGQATKSLEADLARAEAALTIDLDGRRIGFREAAAAQANEPDPGRRQEIEQAQLALTETRLGPLHRDLLHTQHRCAAELGWSSYREMCEECKGVDLAGLAGQTAAFSNATAPAFPELLEPELRRAVGRRLDELRRADLPRFFRATEQDRHFPADRLARSFVETMRGLGIEVGAEHGVMFDLEPRPSKSPRAFCAPVRVPGEVYLVVTPIGGWDDYSAMFHEGGHAAHAANVDPGLPFEFRHLGDDSVSETYAFLLQHLVEDPGWLSHTLGVEDPSDLVTHVRAQRLLHMRRYAAKLAYELDLHGSNGDADLDVLACRYSALLGTALQIPWPRETFLADVDPGFYCACYLRAWALETYLRAYLRERFGPAWFESAEAGEVLRGLWRDGQRLTAEELLAELTGQPLDFAAVLADLGLG
jgi:hypothetical protein